MNSIFYLDQRRLLDQCETSNNRFDIYNQWNQMEKKMNCFCIEHNLVHKFESKNLRNWNVNILKTYLRSSLYRYEKRLFMWMIITLQLKFSCQNNTFYFHLICLFRLIIFLFWQSRRSFEWEITTIFCDIKCVKSSIDEIISSSFLNSTKTISLSRFCTSFFLFLSFRIINQAQEWNLISILLLNTMKSYNFVLYYDQILKKHILQKNK